MKRRRGALRPAQVCLQLLEALRASDGRRRRRKRNTTPDRIGLDLKRELLEAAVREDPEPAAFEGWLARRCASREGEGAQRAVALQVLDEWKLARAAPAFREWLERGAPSDDA